MLNMFENQNFKRYLELYSKYVESRVAVHNYHIRFTEYVGKESYYRLREHVRALPALEKEMLKVAKLAVQEQREIARAEKIGQKQARQKKKLNKSGRVFSKRYEKNKSKFNKWQKKQNSQLDELLKTSDFITIHLPKTKETANLIGADALSKVKPTVRIINAARGGVLDETALYDAIVEGRVAGAGRDQGWAEGGSATADRADRRSHPAIGGAYGRRGRDAGAAAVDRRAP